MFGTSQVKTWARYQVESIYQQFLPFRAQECTELPPYADALRYFTGLPVFATWTTTTKCHESCAEDAITAADFYVTAFRDKPRFGLQDWQREWDGLQEDYFLGKNLTKDEEKLLLTKVGENQDLHSCCVPSTSPSQLALGSVTV